MTRLIAIILCCAFLSACASTQRLEQNGTDAVTWPEFEIKFMRDTPQVEPRECPVSMLQKVKYLKEQTWGWYRADKWFSDSTPDQFFEACPRRQMKLDSWEPVNLVWQPSPFRTIGPAIGNGLGFVAAAGTLGATMPGSKTSITNNNAGTNVRASTFAGDVPTGIGQVPR